MAWNCLIAYFLVVYERIVYKEIKRVVHYSCLVGLALEHVRAFEGEGIDLTDPPPPHTHC